MTIEIDSGNKITVDNKIVASYDRDSYRDIRGKVRGKTIVSLLDMKSKSIKKKVAMKNPVWIPSNPNSFSGWKINPDFEKELKSVL